MVDQVLRRLRRPAGPSGRRLTVNWFGELRFLRMRRACLVIDVSSSGAHVQVEALPPGVRDLRLVLELGPPIAASLAWRRDDRIGLSFHAEQEWLAELGRRRLDSADWLG